MFLLLGVYFLMCKQTGLKMAKLKGGEFITALLFLFN